MDVEDRRKIHLAFEKRFGDAENRVAPQADRTVAIVDRTLGEPFIGDLADIALGAEGDVPFFERNSFVPRQLLQPG